jgi:hypothetical protein
MSPVVQTNSRALDNPEAWIASDVECVQRLALLLESKEGRHLGEIASLISRLTFGPDYTPQF